MKYTKENKERFITEDTEGSEVENKRDPLTDKVIGCAIEVHRNLGPGLLESTYQQCLAHELCVNGLKFQLEHPMPVEYKGMQLDCGYRIDILIESCQFLELKSV